MHSKFLQTRFSPKKVIGFVVFIIADLAIYVLLGLLMMQYDDFYDETKGAYWSWESMSSFDKKVFVSLQIWNFFNILIALYLIFRIYKYIKLRND